MKKLYILSLTTAFFIHNICSDQKASIDTSAIKDSPAPSLKTLTVDPGLLGATTPPAEQNSCPVTTAVSYLSFIVGSNNHFTAVIKSRGDFNIDKNTGILQPTLAARYNYSFKGNKKQNAKINIPIYNVIANPSRQMIKWYTGSLQSEFYDVKKFNTTGTYTLSLAGGKITIKDSKGKVIEPGVLTLKQIRDAAQKAAAAKK